MNEIFDTLPTPGFELKSQGKTYLSDQAVTKAIANPGKFVLLGDGRLVDKAYFPSLELQALRTDAQLSLKFVLEERTKNQSTASGIPSYSYKGRVFACYAASKEEDEAAAARKKARKVEKAKRKASKLVEEERRAN